MPEFRTGAAVSGDRRGGHSWRALLTSLAVVLVVATVPVAVWAVPASVPLVQEAQEADELTAGDVIADGRARLPRGDIAWTIRRLDVPGGEGLAIREFPVGFVLVDKGTVALHAEDDEEPTEFAAGEAAFLPDRKAGTLASVGTDAASLYEMALVSRRDAESASDAEDDEETGVVVGEPFPAPEGATPNEGTPEGEASGVAVFEIELVRNTLTGQDEATIPVSGSGAPVLYLTIEGTAHLQAGEQIVNLDAGQFALLAGEVQVRAAGDTPATFVVAAIGEEAEARERGEREGRAERQREPRERAGGGQGGGQVQSDRAARRAARQARQAQQGQGGRGGQTQQQGTGGTGAPVTGGVGATATVPASDGTPAIEPTAEPTLPTDPTIPADGTPPPTDETAVPTATIPAVDTPTPEPTVPVETPTPEPTVFVPPTNPPVPEVPGVPTVPAEPTVAAEVVPEATLPVEEVPAAEPTAEG